MKRNLTILLILGLVASLLAPTAQAAKKKKKKPVPIDVVYHVVWNGEGCALSTSTAAASAEEACVDPFAGATQSQFGAGPHVMPALDGLPLTLDAAKPIKAHISADSYYAVGGLPFDDVIGIGQPQIHALLTATVDGVETTIGEVTTEPYTVTPQESHYEVDFEFPVAPELAGKVLTGLTLAMEIEGDALFHGVFPADGTSTLTVGAFGTK